MPRKNPLDVRQAEICARLAEFRKLTGLTRTAFARKSGLDSSAITRLDHGLAPLRYGTFKSIATVLPINPIWLATGRESPSFKEPVKASLLAHPVNDSDLFSIVYDRFLAAYFGLSAWKLTQYFDELARSIISIGDFLKEHGNTLSSEVREQVESRLVLLAWVMNKIAKSEYVSTSDLIIEAENLGRIFSTKKDFTKTATQSSIADVNSLWPALKQRLQTATAKTGKKSELAKFLKVDLTRVSQWLTNKKSAREPGAEYTLQMLHWVEQQERQ